MPVRILISLITGFMCIQPAFAAGVFRVNAASTATSPDGQSWDMAFHDIQSGVNAASANGGGEVWVAGGIYAATTGLVLRMNVGVAVYGGFSGTETARDQRDWRGRITVIDGQNAFQCVVGANNATLDGFVVRHGLGAPNGGGAYNNGCSVRFANCTFSDNVAGIGSDSKNSKGGGMYNYDASLVLTNCTFSRNSASFGAGIYSGYFSLSELRNCTFYENTASSYGGGIDNITSTLSLDNCVFSDNTAYGGAGVDNNNSDVFALNCIFSRNHTGYAGGGLYNIYSSARLTNCVFAGNTVNSVYQGNGGGVFNYHASPSVTNCTFFGNSVSYGGAAMCNYYSSAPIMTNCILWGDTAPNGPEIYCDASSEASVSGSCVQGGYAGVANLSADPLFVLASSGNLQLNVSSPCIDSGIDLGVTSTDLLGNPRRQGKRIDMGAYELPYAKMVAVPDVSGWTPEAASTLLGVQTLSVGAVSTEYSRSVPAGRVTGQSPAAGTLVMALSMVSLTLSLGPRTFTLSYVTDPAGAGLVTGPETVADGATATVAVAANPGYVLSSWNVSSGSITASAPHMLSGVTENTTVTAVFAKTNPVDYLAIPLEGGTVTGPAAIQDTVGTVTVTATANAGYSIASVTASNGNISAGPPYILSDVTADTTITASFTPHANTITYSATPATNGTVTGPAIVLTGDTAPVTVTANTGYSIASVMASNGTVSDSPPYMLSNVTADTTVTAVFTANTNRVTYVASPAEGGMVTGAATVLTGDTVPVSVTANTGYSIASVTASNGTVSDSAPYMLYGVTESTTVTATFAAKHNPVGYLANPVESGAVSGPETVDTGTTATLSVTVNPGYTLSSLTVSNGSITLTAPYILSHVTEDTTVTASFTANSNTAIYASSPSAGGTVTGPATILTGENATVSVTANPGYTLSSLTASNGSITAGAPHVLSGMTANTTVTASFTANSNTVVYAYNPSAGGAVTGPATILTGENATVSVTANPGYTLSSLTASNGSITAGAPHVLSGVTANTTVTASFTANSNTVTYAPSPPAGGTVTGPATILTGGGATVLVTVNRGYTLSSLTVSNGSITANAPYILSNVNADTTVTAAFARQIVTVPDVTGQAQSVASETITDAGLVVGRITEDFSDTVPLGRVVRQTPAGGAQEPWGSTVDIVISKGVDVIMPDVLGMTQAVAESSIQSANIVVGLVVYDFSDAVPAGRVLSQSPPGGTRIALNIVASLVVSLGPKVTMPNLSEMTLEDAQAAIAAAGLTAHVTEAANDSVAVGMIISQTPGAGMAVPQGSTVNIVVSTGPQDTGGCAGCSRGKGAFTLDRMKRAFGDLFLGGLSLMVLFAVTRSKP